MTSEQRVQRLLALASDLADPASSLGKVIRERLYATIPLSKEGIELALCHHLEHDVEPVQVRRFAAGAEEAERCHLLLSSNVCTGALRALAWSLATAPQVFVRPSRRDPALANMLAAHMPEVELVDRLEPSTGDVAHLYGSDETLAKVVAGFPNGVRSFCHGSGFAVAVVDNRDSYAARDLARDLVVFDGRGCLSPRVVFALKRDNFGEELHQALLPWDRGVPRATLHASEKAELSMWSQNMRALGRLWVGGEHAVGSETMPPRLTLPPAHRCLVVVEVATLEDVIGLLAPWALLLTCIGGRQELSQKVIDAIETANVRLAPLGKMQTPPFDGPVDLRPRRDPSWGEA